MFDSPSKKKTDKKKEGWSWFKKPEYQEPKSMVAIWTEDTLIQPGKPVTRGFGGRIFFYNEKSQAIPVDGELVVYGFDDSSTTKSSNASPSQQELEQSGRKFRFTAEQFTQHFSHSELGASYSVWIPWDAAGGEQKKIMLLPTFITKDQRVVRGDSSKIPLSGKPASIAVSKQSSNNAIQLASANIPTAQSSPATQPPVPSLQAGSVEQPSQNIELGIKTTTIRMQQPINAGFNSNPSANAYPTSNWNPSHSMPSTSQQQLTLASQAAPPTQPVPMNSTTLSNSQLPVLGHDIPATGWMQQGRPLQAPTALSGATPPNQFPAQGLPAWQ